MPGVEVEERHQEVEPNRRDRRNNQIREDVVAKLVWVFGISALKRV